MSPIPMNCLFIWCSYFHLCDLFTITASLRSLPNLLRLRFVIKTILDKLFHLSLVSLCIYHHKTRFLKTDSKCA